MRHSKPQASGKKSGGNEDYMAVCIGVDLGGTQVRAGAVDSESGRLLGHVFSRSSSLGTSRGQNGSSLAREIEAVLTSIVHVVREAMDSVDVRRSQVLGVGVAVPDPVKADGTLAFGCTTMIGWDGENIKELLATHLRSLGVKTVWVGNDVNAHAIGELRYGIGRGVRNADFVYFALGTGIGAGIIANGELRVGFTGCAGEWGHIVVDSSGPKCLGCGRQNGCLEMMAGGIGIAFSAKTLIDNGAAPGLRHYIERSGPTDDSEGLSAISSFKTSTGRYVDARTVINLAKGELPNLTTIPVSAQAEATDIVQKAGEAFGKGIVQVLHSLNPSQVVVGGSVANAGDLYFAPARKWVEEHALPAARDNVQIRVSLIKEEAAILGAAASVSTEGN